MSSRRNISDSYEAYYGTEAGNYSLLDFLRALGIMFMPPLACISFVLICVYLCLVRPQQKQRRAMFAMSSAAFIAQSYMARMEIAGTNLEPPQAAETSEPTPSPNTTQEAAANRDTIEVVDDITEAFTLLHSAKISTITKTTTTTITPEAEERKAKLMKLSNNALMEKIESDAPSRTGSISSWSVKL